MLLASKEMRRVSPINWISKIIERVCDCSKDSEMFILSKMVKDAIFEVWQIETVLF